MLGSLLPSVAGMRVCTDEGPDNPSPSFDWAPLRKRDQVCATLSPWGEGESPFPCSISPANPVQ